jgi:trigger factor
MKGFRKGKVPINIIKKYYGKKIEVEALEEISNETFQKFLEEEKISLVGTPKLINLDDKDGSYKFTIRYEVIPDFELADYRGIVIDEPVHPVTDEEIEKEVEMLCRNNGNLEDTEQVIDELHIADVTIQEIDESTQVPIIGQKAQETKIFLADEYVLPEMKTNLLNTKVEDNFVFRPGQYDPNAPDKTYRVTVKDIKKLVPVEFTNEFVDKYSQGKFKTTEELREEIGFQMQEKWDEKTRREIENQLITKIVEMNEFDVPDSVVHNVIEAMAADIKKRYANTPNADKLDTAGMAEGLRPLAERTVRWEIIRNQIMKKEDIAVEDHDIEEIVNAEVERTKENADLIRNKLKKNKQLTDSIISKKVTDLLIDFAITEEILFEEYEKKMGPEHDHEHEHDDEENKSNIIT